MLNLILLCGTWAASCIICGCIGAFLVHRWFVFQQIDPNHARDKFISDWFQEGRHFVHSVFSPPRLDGRVGRDGVPHSDATAEMTPPRLPPKHPLDSPDSPWEMPSPSGTRSRFVQPRTSTQEVRSRIHSNRLYCR